MRWTLQPRRDGTFVLYKLFSAVAVYVNILTYPDTTIPKCASGRPSQQQEHRSLLGDLGGDLETRFRGQMVEWPDGEGSFSFK